MMVYYDNLMINELLCIALTNKHHSIMNNVYDIKSQIIIESSQQNIIKVYKYLVFEINSI